MYEYGTLRLIMKKSLVTVKCYTCEKDFEKLGTQYRHAIKVNPEAVFYCSRHCYHSNRRPCLPKQEKVEKKCSFCTRQISVYASQIKVTGDFHFCDTICWSLLRKEQAEKESKIELQCKKCGITFMKHKCRIFPGKNHYCSRACSDYKYQVNRFVRTRPLPIHKIGRKNKRRSYLEYYIEDMIKQIFPTMKYYTNKRFDGFELDFYFPDLLLAVEINGPFHYFPIFGNDALSYVQRRDLRRIESCSSHHVDLRIIPVKESTQSIRKKEFYWLKFERIILGKLQEKIILNEHRGFH